MKELESSRWIDGSRRGSPADQLFPAQGLSFVQFSTALGSRHLSPSEDQEAE
jgi:hypothetical protein